METKEITVKEYLSQAKFLDQRINSKIQQVAALNDLATKATSTLTGMPRNPNHATSSMEDVIAKIIDLQAEINNDIDKASLKSGICVSKAGSRLRWRWATNCAGYIESTARRWRRSRPSLALNKAAFAVQ